MASVYRIGFALMLTAMLCVVASGVIPGGFLVVLAGHICLFIGYVLTVIADIKMGRNFDFLRLAFAFLIAIGLYIMGPVAMAGARY
jgi:hypothetical protein